MTYLPLLLIVIIYSVLTLKLKPFIFVKKKGGHIVEYYFKVCNDLTTGAARDPDHT